MKLQLLSPYERIRLLQSLPFFEALEADDLAVLAEHAHEEHRPRGSFLITRGEPLDAVRVLVEGEAVMTRDSAAVRQIVGPGSPIGFITVLSEGEDGIEVITSPHDVAHDQKRGLVRSARGPLLDPAPHPPSDRATAPRRVRREWRSGRITLRDEVCGSDPRSCAEDDDERFMVLRSHLPFGERDLFALWHLSRRATSVSFGAAEVLFPQGTSSTAAFLVIEGTVRCRSEGSDRDTCFGPGAVVGLVDTLAEAERSYLAIAETDCVTLRIDHEELIDMFEDHFEIALDCLTITARITLALMAASS